MNSRLIQTAVCRKASNNHRVTFDVDRQHASGQNGEKANVLLQAHLPHSGVPTKPAILNSWKDIAAYFGRGIRTVQRWELQWCLPIHRPAGKHRSAVLALQEELDEWLRCTPLHFTAQKKHNLANSLLEIARDLEAIGEQLVSRTDQQARPNVEELVNGVRTIVDELRLLTNVDDGVSHSSALPSVEQM